MNFLVRLFTGNPLLRLIILAVLDALVIIGSVWIAFLLRFEGFVPSEHIANAVAFTVLTLAVAIPLFVYLKLYAFSFSYVSTDELIHIARANLLAFLCVGLLLFLLRETPLFSGFPRSALLLSFILIFLLTSFLRFGKRIFREIIRGKYDGKKERTLIVGAGDAGVQILRSIRENPDSPYAPVGFIDDDQNKKGRIIYGIPILGRLEDIGGCVKTNMIERMIVALPSAGSTIIKHTVERGREAGIKKIKIVPSMAELMSDEITLQSLQEVHVEDLLGREPVIADEERIKELVNKKTVLITGAAGSIGSELSRQIARFQPEHLLLLDNDETRMFHIGGELQNKFPSLPIQQLVVNIRDAQKIESLFKTFRPHLVFHAAAFKHVPLMEQHPDEAVKNNVFGTRIILEAAVRNLAEKVVLISTDKAVNPSSVMGMTKRIGEKMFQACDKIKYTRCICVRFGNVLDSRGSVIPIFKEQIRKGGPVQVTHPEMERYFMLTEEACLLVLQAGAIGNGGEIFVLDMGKPVKILTLAQELIRLSGFEPDQDIPIVFTNPRPGEKFTEELITEIDAVIQTEYSKIVKIKDGGTVDGETLFAHVDTLDQYFNDHTALKTKLKELAS
ncbi:polysaccharide biosynthesis protein [Candidatus Uhrbacteria bacterium]|nr:polysaccharide biosynthesis protein [Candidatus Uhrbacteria bacterium]